jgi:quercetin dioxygenase-like cupin family protein
MTVATDSAGFPSAVAISAARYFMVMGIDVAVRTDGVLAQDCLSVSELIVPRNAGMPSHSVPVPTLLVGLGGTLVLQVDGKVIALNDSQSAYLPSGTRYAYRNGGREEARIMLIALGRQLQDFLADVARNPHDSGWTVTRR